MSYLSRIESIITGDFKKWDSGIWIHYSSISLVKVNPSTKFHDPAGVYLFPEKFDTEGGWKTYKYKHYVKLASDLKVLDLSEISMEQATSLLKGFGLQEEVSNLKSSSNYIDSFWDILTNNFGSTPGKFNKLFRDLGYDAIFDDTGSVHISEVQLIVLNPSKITVIKTEERKKKDTFTKYKHIFDSVVSICSKYGKLEIDKPKKRYVSYTRDYRVIGYIKCTNGEKYLSWKLTLSNSPGDRYVGNEKDKIPSQVELYLSTEGFTKTIFISFYKDETLKLTEVEDFTKKAMLGTTASVKEANWRNLTDREIEQEYEWEYAYESKRTLRHWAGNAFPDINFFKEAVKKAKVISLTPSLDDKISFRSQTKSLDDLKNLVGSYRFPRDVDKIVDGLTNGHKLPYPIVLKRSDGAMRVFSGNTRLDASFILNYQPKVLLVDLPK